ncbi:peptidoglycan DD-metalloendopeptidase family protein [bacterium]|nr:peptidoglycan DD-metalloendopeptidase family protein [bacterium]
MDKYLTFLYVRRGNAGVKSIRIHRMLVVFSFAFFLFLMAVFVFSSIKYAGVQRKNFEMVNLQRENVKLHGKLDEFSARVNNLNKRMDNNFELQNRVRMLAGMDPLSKDVWQVGVGGPAPYGVVVDGDVSDYLSSSSKKNLDKLFRQSRLELENYKDIMDILQKEKKIRDCTPTIRPLKGGFVSSGYGPRMDPFSGRLAMHKGVDFCARNGTPVTTTADGVVTIAGENGGFGLVVEVNHRIGFETKYAHMSRILVKRGQRIKRGEVIGLVGSTGRSTGSHLHYEVVFRGVSRNPLHYIIPEDLYFE